MTDEKWWKELASEEDHREVVISVPWDPQNAIFIPGVKKKLCDGCGKDLCLAPSSQPIIDRGGLLICLDDCFPKLKRALGDDAPPIEPTPDWKTDFANPGMN